MCGGHLQLQVSVAEGVWHDVTEVGVTYSCRLAMSKVWGALTAAGQCHQGGGAWCHRGGGHIQLQVSVPKGVGHDVTEVGVTYSCRLVSPMWWCMMSQRWGSHTAASQCPQGGGAWCHRGGGHIQLQVSVLKGVGHDVTEVGVTYSCRTMIWRGVTYSCRTVMWRGSLIAAGQWCEGGHL